MGSKCRSHSKKTPRNRFYSINGETEGAGKVHWTKNPLPTCGPCSSSLCYPSLLPWERLLCTFEALRSITSLLALFALHHLGARLNSSAEAFSHCLLTALFRPEPAAPIYLKVPPYSALWFIRWTLSYYHKKYKHPIMTEKCNYHSCKTR